MAATADLVIRIVSDTSKAAGGLNEVSDSTGRMASGIKKAALPAAAALAGLGAAAFSAADAAAEDARAAAVLATNLKTAAGATDAQVAATEAFIDKTARATGVADDQLRPAMSALALATGDTETAQSALTASLDASVATGKDVQSVSEAIAKAYGGSTTSLGKLIPSLDKATLAGGDMSAIMADLADKTGGAAAAAADTAAGSMARQKVAMDEAQESIGAALLPAMSKLATVMAALANAAGSHPAIFYAIAGAIAAVSLAVLAANVIIAINTALTIANSSTLGTWLGVKALEAGAWIAATASSVAATVAMVAATVATLAEAAAVWVLNAAIAVLTSPITLVILAVIALVAAFVLLWKNSETFRDIVTGVWDAVKAGAVGMANFVVSAWNAIKSAVEATFNWVKGNWPTILAILTGPIGIAVGIIVKNWDQIRDAAARVFDAVKTGWDNMVSALKTSVSGLGAVLSAPFDAMKSAIQWVIDKVNELIGALGRIHVPHISLPHIPGTTAAPATGARSAGGVVPRVSGVSSRGATPAAGAVVINVTGAIDPEATARQIRRILAGSDRRMGLAP